MNKHLDGATFAAKRFLGRREDLIHLVANWVNETTANRLREVFEGTLSTEKFWTGIDQSSAGFIERLAAVHEIPIIAVPEDL